MKKVSILWTENGYKCIYNVSIDSFASVIGTKHNDLPCILCFKERNKTDVPLYLHLC